MERSGVQETTGMCRMVGGWPRERERGQKKQKSEGIASHVGIKLRKYPYMCCQHHTCQLD